MQYLVRFQRIPTAYSNKECVLVEADDPVKAVLVMRDKLLRRGDDPDGFVPNISYHVRELKKLTTEGTNNDSVRGTAALYNRSPEEERAKKIEYHQRMMREEVDKYVTPYECGTH